MAKRALIKSISLHRSFNTMTFVRLHSIQQIIKEVCAKYKYSFTILHIWALKLTRI